VHISANSCTQTDRQMDGHPHTTTDRSTNLIISSNSLRSIGGDNNDTSSFFCAMRTGLCPDWQDWNPANNVDNATEAMDAAEQWLDVPQVCQS